MAKYMIKAPNGKEVSISYAYGNKTLKHGDIVENDSLARLFPSIFIEIVDEIKETVKEVKQEVVEFVEVTKDVVSEIAEETKEAISEFVDDVKDVVSEIVEDVKEKIEDIKEEKPKKPTAKVKKQTKTKVKKDE